MKAIKYQLFLYHILCQLQEFKFKNKLMKRTVAFIIIIMLYNCNAVIVSAQQTKF